MAHEAGAHGHADHLEGDFAHPIPIWILLATFFALVMLTFLTVGLAQLPLGKWEIWTSLVIASIKAALVMAFFMHLRWDKPLNTVIFLSSLIFATLFLGFTLMDSMNYRDRLEPNVTAPPTEPSWFEPAK
jgi:cytochrome c oxidase subunit 4